MEDLHEVLNGLLLRQFLLGFEVGQQVPFVAEFQDQVNIVGRLLDIDEPHDVIIATALKHLYFVLQQFSELSCIWLCIPLILSRLIVFTATSTPSTLLYPLYTSPNCPEPILVSKT